MAPTCNTGEKIIGRTASFTPISFSAGNYSPCCMPATYWRRNWECALALIGRWRPPCGCSTRRRHWPRSKHLSRRWTTYFVKFAKMRRWPGSREKDPIFMSTHQEVNGLARARRFPLSPPNPTCRGQIRRPQGFRIFLLLCTPGN